MITLPDGFRFSVMAASGALAYGRGWWWERYGLIPLGVLSTRGVVPVTKTLTYHPRRGNLRMWAPWRSVLPWWRSGGCLNAVGLTNPGWEWWDAEGYEEYATRRDLIVSVRPDTVEQARWMSNSLRTMFAVRGVEFNASCPNVASPPADKVRWVLDRFEQLEASGVPVGVKLGATDQYPEICEKLDGRAAWFTLINAVPWPALKQAEPSPLGRHTGGFPGAVSGPDIVPHARKALFMMRGTLRTPIVSGGGIMTPAEAVWRMNNGAAAVALGTVFLTRPWRVRRIVKAVDAWEGEQCRTNS